jgi:hypothetical protein
VTARSQSAHRHSNGAVGAPIRLALTASVPCDHAAAVAGRRAAGLPVRAARRRRRTTTAAAAVAAAGAGACRGIQPLPPAAAAAAAAATVPAAAATVPAARAAAAPARRAALGRRRLGRGPHPGHVGGCRAAALRPGTGPGAAVRGASPAIRPGPPRAAAAGRRARRRGALGGGAARQRARRDSAARAHGAAVWRPRPAGGNSLRRRPGRCLAGRGALRRAACRGPGARQPRVAAGLGQAQGGAGAAPGVSPHVQLQASAVCLPEARWQGAPGVMRRQSVRVATVLAWCGRRGGCMWPTMPCAHLCSTWHAVAGHMHGSARSLWRCMQGTAHARARHGPCAPSRPSTPSSPARRRYFNLVQSECFDVVHGSDASLVVAAPTGSGKTGAHALCCRAQWERAPLSTNGGDGCGSQGRRRLCAGGLKASAPCPQASWSWRCCGCGASAWTRPASCCRRRAVAKPSTSLPSGGDCRHPRAALAERGAERGTCASQIPWACPHPTAQPPPAIPRALVQERHQDWAARFGPLGLNVAELSGDNDADVRELEGADLVCTTPEKFGARQGRAGERRWNGLVVARVHACCAEGDGTCQPCTQWDRV